MAEAEASETTSGGILQEIFTSPLNLTLLSLCLFLLYKIVRGDKQPDIAEEEKPLPKMKKRDFTIAELKPYDGIEDPRILMAVNGKVFDVTRGKKFYGPGNVSLTYFSWKCWDNPAPTLLDFANTTSSSAGPLLIALIAPVNLGGNAINWYHNFVTPTSVICYFTNC